MPTAATDDLKPMGRPRKDRRAPTFHQGKLYALLMKKLPEYVERGRLDTARLAPKVGYARYTLYNWMGRDRLTPRAAKAIQAAAGGKITDKDILPFLLES